MGEAKIIFKINPTAKLAKFFFVLAIIGLSLVFLNKFLIFISLLFLLIASNLAIVRKFTTFLLTDKYVSLQVGILVKKTVSMPLDKIQNVVLKKTLFQQLIDIGEIVIESAGEKGGFAENEIVMTDIDKPDYYQKLIMEAISKNR